MTSTRSQRTLGQLSPGTASTTIGNKEIKALVLDEAYPGCLPKMAPDGPDYVIYIYLDGYTMYVASQVEKNGVIVSNATVISEGLKSALVHVDPLYQGRHSRSVKLYRVSQWDLVVFKGLERQDTGRVLSEAEEQVRCWKVNGH